MEWINVSVENDRDTEHDIIIIEHSPEIIAIIILFVPVFWVNVTIWMPVAVTFIMYVLIVIPKSSADEWIEYVATDCHGCVWCDW